VRNARVVLVDGGEGVRAPVVASWLQQLGWDAWVLEGGVRSGLEGPAPARPNLPVLVTISAGELKRALDLGDCAVFDLGASMDYRKAHIPGSRWSTRARLAADARDEKRTIVLAGESGVARLAATELMDSGAGDVKLLAGGREGWAQAGYSTEASPGSPADAECIDYLFFVHDRHAGNPEAMRQYLAWETGLLGQLDGQDRTAFRIPVA
jgi:rhodanese-related sulfurtransferase